MTNGELEDYINQLIEQLYTGLTGLANTTRANGSPDDLADQLQALADDLCRHWPTCRTAHDLDSEIP